MSVHASNALIHKSGDEELKVRQLSNECLWFSLRHRCNLLQLINRVALDGSRADMRLAILNIQRRQQCQKKTTRKAVTEAADKRATIAAEAKAAIAAETKAAVKVATGAEIPVETKAAIAAETKNNELAARRTGISDLPLPLSVNFVAD